MDIWVIGSQRCERTDDFAAQARARGINVVRLAPGDAVALSMEQLAGVICFDDGTPALAGLLADLERRVHFLSVQPIRIPAQQATDGNQATSKDLLQQLEAQIEATPVAPEWREQVLEPFIAATVTTLQEMAGTEAFMQVCYRKKHPTMLGDLSAVIGLVSETGGAMVFGCGEETAAILARRVLAGTVEQPEPALVRDCLGEIANVISGQAKTMLFGTPYHFSLTTPTILTGIHHQAIPGARDTTCLVAVFGSDVGEMVVQVCLRL